MYVFHDMEFRSIMLTVIGCGFVCIKADREYEVKLCMDLNITSKGKVDSNVSFPNFVDFHSILQIRTFIVLEKLSAWFIFVRYFLR